jgi:large subunit ribosomal protein L20
MPRVKRGTIANKKRKKTLSQVKGFRFGRGTKERMAKDAILHAGMSAFRDRRDKKNNFRMLWNIKINAALKPFDLSYSKFIGILKTKNIDLDRKVMAQLAETYPEVFARLVESVKA